MEKKSYKKIIGAIIIVIFIVMVVRFILSGIIMNDASDTIRRAQEQRQKYLQSQEEKENTNEETNITNDEPTNNNQDEIEEGTKILEDISGENHDEE